MENGVRWRRSVEQRRKGRWGYGGLAGVMKKKKKGLQCKKKSKLRGGGRLGFFFFCAGRGEGLDRFLVPL